MRMTEQDKDTSLWGKAADVERQEGSKRQHDVSSNLLTLLLTGAIIAVGFLLPTLLYPHLDRYQGETVLLARPSESTHVFKEPVTLYPWNIYEEERLRALSTADRELLEERGVPAFLVATLRDHGLHMEFDESFYHAQIINAFRYLDPQDSSETGCFILVDADIDEDERADLRCAVDPNGNVISLLLVSTQWDTVRIEMPIGVKGVPPTPESMTAEQTTSESPVVNPSETQEATSAQTQTEAEPTTEAGPPVGTAEAEGAEGAEAEAETAGEAGENAEGDSGAFDAAEPGSAPPAVARPTIEYLPLEEDQYLWSFAYVMAREAKAIEQQELFVAFRQLELTYEYRYGYPFTMLLPVQPAEPEVLPEVEYASLTPTVFATEDYLLSIYDLPNGERLILYLNPTSLRCMGFNLLRF
jgi:hypothetical protein